MKTKLLCALFLLFLSSVVHAQAGWHQNFDDGLFENQVHFDTVSNVNCAWEIGIPSKSVFNSSFSPPRVLITDSLNGVRASDTSVVSMSYVSAGGGWNFGLMFYYQMDGDSGDFGKVEISPDNKQNWVDVLAEDTTYWITYFGSPKPTLRGSTQNGWQLFQINMYDWIRGFGAFPHPFNGDTVWLRLTYITDSSSVLRDGWMIENIEFIDNWEGIEDGRESGLMDIYPNPSKGPVQIRLREKFIPGKLTVLDFAGRVVYHSDSFSGGELDASIWPKGLYVARFETENRWDAKRFVIR